MAAPMRLWFQEKSLKCTTVGPAHIPVRYDLSTREDCLICFPLLFKIVYFKSMDEGCSSSYCSVVDTMKGDSSILTCLLFLVWQRRKLKSNSMVMVTTSHLIPTKHICPPPWLRNTIINRFRMHAVCFRLVIMFVRSVQAFKYLKALTNFKLCCYKIYLGFSPVRINKLLFLTMPNNPHLQVLANFLQEIELLPFSLS